MQIDDVWMFFNILDTSFIYAGFSPQYGRFVPFAFWDLNILMTLFPLSDIKSAAKVYFAFNAVCFVLLFAIVFACVKTLANSKIALLSCVIIFINLGFVIIITGICYPEKMQSVFLGVFILSAFYVFYKQSDSRLLIVLCALSAFMSLFYKETDFIFIGGFGGAYIMLQVLYSYLKTHKLRLESFKNRNLCLYFIAIAMLFLALYAIIILPDITTSYTATHSQRGKLILRDIFNCVVNHPFLFIFLPSLMLVRLREIVASCKKREFGALELRFIFFDALALCVVACILGYFSLRLFSAYYFFPHYILGFLPAVFYALRYGAKWLFIAVFALYLLVNVPLALSTYTTTKILPPNYLKAVSFMADLSHTKPTNIFLLGQNRDADGLMYYDFMKRFLLYFGAENFDLQTMKANPPNFTATPSTYTIFNSHIVSVPQKGDLLYLDANSKDFVTKAYLADLEDKYELVFASTYSGFYNINAKSLAKYLLQDSAIYGKYLKIDRISSNIFRAPLGVYVYRVK